MNIDNNKYPLLYNDTYINNYTVNINDPKDNRTIKSFILHEPTLEAIPLLKGIFKNNVDLCEDKNITNNPSIDLYAIIMKYALVTPMFDFTYITPLQLSAVFTDILQYIYSSYCSSNKYKQKENQFKISDVFDCNEHKHKSGFVSIETDIDKLLYVLNDYNITDNILFFVVDILCIDLIFLCDKILDIHGLYEGQYEEKYDITDLYNIPIKEMHTFNDFMFIKSMGLYVMSALHEYSISSPWNNKYFIEGGKLFCNKHIENYALIKNDNIILIHNVLIADEIEPLYVINVNGYCDARIKKYHEIKDNTDCCDVHVDIIKSIIKMLYGFASNNYFSPSTLLTNEDLGYHYWAIISSNIIDCMRGSDKLLKMITELLQQYIHILYFPIVIILKVVK